MPAQCVVEKCESRKVKNCGISFFKFPLSDPDLLSKWTAAISRIFWIPTTFYEICELHFKENYFSGTKRKKLKPNAVPTENLDIQSEVPSTSGNDIQIEFGPSEEIITGSQAPSIIESDNNEHQIQVQTNNLTNLHITNLDMTIVNKVKNILALDSMIFENFFCEDVDLLEVPYKIKLITLIASRYIQIRLYSYAKFYAEEILKPIKF